MSTESNSYADKVFGEHPIGLWTFDDDVYYTSLLTGNIKNLTTWNPSGTYNGHFSTSTAVTSPIDGETVYKYNYDNQVGGVFPSSLKITSDLVDSAFKASNLSDLLGKTVTLSGYFYFSSSLTQSISLKLLNTIDETELTQLIQTPVHNNWVFITHTFNMSSLTGDFDPMLEIAYSNVTNLDNYSFYVSGLSLGQWSENFAASTIGSAITSIPTTIDVGVSKGVAAKSYGLQNLDGYYLTRQNPSDRTANMGILTSSNSSVPMVFGSSSATTLHPNPTASDAKTYLGAYNPSIIIPGLGFLNNSGRYKDYTAEFWMKANPKVPLGNADETTHRIFGPIGSDDGVYVTNSTIMIKVGDVTGSYSVGEWYRPMLLDFTVSKNVASLLINGETVISTSIDMSTTVLPSKLVVAADVSGDPLASQRIGKDQDWLGFYSGQYMAPFEIDCAAIYPYTVSEVVAKRRFVYGQGVEFPENINKAYSGTSTYIDYAFSKYDNNYTYPGSEGWNQGSVDGFLADSFSLSIPKQDAPLPSFNNKNASSWISTISPLSELPGTPAGTRTIRLIPTEQWKTDLTEGYLHIADLNIFNRSKPAAIIVRVSDDVQQYTAREEVILHIRDSASSDHLEISVDAGLIKYSTYINGAVNIFHQETRPIGSDIGIDVTKLSNHFGGDVSSFLNRSSNSLYVGGRPDYTKTFSGGIKKVILCTPQNLKKFETFFSSIGILGDITSNDETINHLGTYNLSAKKEFGIYSLVVGSSAYWEDYIPLTKLATYVEDESGNKVYDLDYIQINAHSLLTKEAEYYIGASGSNTIPAENSDILTETYSPVKMYVSFKKNSISSAQQLTYLKNSKNKLVDVSLDADWENRKYEVVNGSIVYPPTGDINDLSIVIHIEANTVSTKDYPVFIKSLQIASRSLSKSSNNPIGTRFGNDIYPYIKTGTVYDYSGKNPVSIKKSNTPYLYLTETSGIEQVGDSYGFNTETNTSRGISIPVNNDRALEYKLIAMQSFIKIRKDIFTQTLPISTSIQKEIFEIESKNKTLKFYLEPVGTYTGNDFKRAKIVCKDSVTGIEENGISFFWNGKIVKNPVITVDEWGVLGIGFPDVLTFDDFSGAIRFTGPIMFDSVSHYEATNLQEIQKKITRPWNLVKETAGGPIVWTFWQTYTWDGVLVYSTEKDYDFSIGTIYKSYVGTNRILVDDGKSVQFNSHQFKLYMDSSWKTYTVSPV